MIGQTISGVHARHNYDGSPKPRGQVEMGFPALWQGWIWCERKIFSHFSLLRYTKSNIQKLCNMYFQELLIPRRWQKSSQIFAHLKDWHRWVVSTILIYLTSMIYEVSTMCMFADVYWHLLAPTTGTLPGVSFVYLASKLRPEQLIWWHFWDWLACQTSKHWVFFLHILIYTFLKYYFSLSHIYSSFIKVYLFSSELKQLHLVAICTDSNQEIWKQERIIRLFQVASSEGVPSNSMASCFISFNFLSLLSSRSKSIANTTRRTWRRREQRRCSSNWTSMTMENWTRRSLSLVLSRFGLQS